jgi:cytoskeletal protein CcmA (bactofilin family)
MLISREEAFMSGAKSFFAKGDPKILPLPASEEISAFLGKETVFEGKMTFKGVFRLEGKFQGEIFESGTLIVGETAVVRGKIGVSAVVIHGLVEGEIQASARVEIHSTGKFYGNLFAPVFVIHEGGVFDGHCKMDQPSETEERVEEEDKLRPLFKKNHSLPA